MLKSSIISRDAKHAYRRNGSPQHEDGNPACGSIIINADDWGHDRLTTDRILDCVDHGTVSSVSAMVFMEDAERSAVLARKSGIDAGLHLNLTTQLSASYCPARVLDYQQQIAAHLLRHAFARVVFHPGLIRQFQYVVAAQIDEFCRLYGSEPKRIDGHHHIHLCTNVLLQGLLPSGTLVRRNFSFQPHEKGIVNRLYRKAVDRHLARSHHTTDYFFSLAPLDDPRRLQEIFSLGRGSVVEVETHPVNSAEYKFLLGPKVLQLAADSPIASSSGARGLGPMAKAT
jgi:predicted glycoside hydrolase/deacetylase ChbG (UPF0249 family)